MAYKSAFSLFNDSKEAVFANPWAFLVLVFLPSFLIIIGEAMNGGQSWMLPRADVAPGSDTSLAFQMVGGLLSLLFFAAGVYLELQATQGKTPTVNEALTHGMRYFWRLLGLLLVMLLAIAVGLLALVVPGIILIQRFFLAPYFLVDKDLGIQEALSASWQASKGKAGPIWSVIGVMVLYSLFSIIPIFGSLIATVLITLYTCAPAFRYYELIGKNTHHR